VKATLSGADKSRFQFAPVSYRVRRAAVKFVRGGGGQTLASSLKTALFRLDICFGFI